MEKIEMDTNRKNQKLWKHRENRETTRERSHGSYT